MKEIKFRGKNKDIGWVYGQLVYDINGNPYIVQEVEQDNSYGLEETILYAIMWYRVDKETVGQYTGLKDKNEKEIYEGDIIKYPLHWIGDIEVPEGITPILWNDEEAEYYLSNDYITNLFDLTRNLGCEVIGNIYDNSELLGGTNERY